MAVTGIDHFIASGSLWLQDGLKYRRHRLCEHLLTDPRTGRVFYLAPFELSFRRFLRSLRDCRNETRRLENGVHQIAIADIRSQARYGGFLDRWVVRAVNQSIEPGRRRVLWYTNPSFPALCSRLSWEKVIYDCSDLWNREQGGGRKLAAEQCIARRCDVAFATTNHLADQIRALGGPDAAVIENGVDFDLFRNSVETQLSDIPRPRLGFVGGLKFKIDFDLIRLVAERFPAAQIVLIGPVDDSVKASAAPLATRPNIHFLGGVDFDRVPGHMKALDVGLLPYKQMDYNKAVSPLKLFEYLAAGIPAVGTGLPTTAKYSQEGVYSYTDAGAEEFVALCGLAIDSANDPQQRCTRQRVAERHDWQNKFRRMVDRVLESDSGN
jgi:teichuronic acid biosynthesis glycosyltransferase TuaH